MRIAEICRVLSDGNYGNVQMRAELGPNDDPKESMAILDAILRDCLDEIRNQIDIKRRLLEEDRLKPMDEEMPF